MKLNPKTISILKTWKEDYKVNHKLSKFIIVGDEDFELAQYFCKRYPTSQSKKWIRTLDKQRHDHSKETNREFYKENPFRLPDSVWSACIYRRRHEYGSSGERGIRKEIEKAVETEFKVPFFTRFYEEVYSIFSYRTETYKKSVEAQDRHEKVNRIALDWDFSIAQSFLSNQEEKQ